MPISLDMIILSQDRAFPAASHIASRRTASRHMRSHQSRSYYRPFIAYHRVSIAEPSYQMITISQIPAASHITAYRQRADTHANRFAYPRRIITRSLIGYLARYNRSSGTLGGPFPAPRNPATGPHAPLIATCRAPAYRVTLGTIALGNSPLASRSPRLAIALPYAGAKCCVSISHLLYYI